MYIYKTHFLQLFISVHDFINILIMSYYFVVFELSEIDIPEEKPISITASDVDIGCIPLAD